jgi:hypothetical protein
MMQSGFIATGLWLGFFVLAGGSYGILYGAASLRASASLRHMGYACYAVQLLTAVALCIASPLSAPWKWFIAASGIAYGFIPPAIWRLLEAMHDGEARQARQS